MQQDLADPARQGGLLLDVWGQNPTNASVPWSDQRLRPFPRILGRDRLPP